MNEHDVIERDAMSKELTCLNFWDASSLPAFLSGCHFNACELGDMRSGWWARGINKYHFLVCLFDVLV